MHEVGQPINDSRATLPPPRRTHTRTQTHTRNWTLQFGQLDNNLDSSVPGQNIQSTGVWPPAVPHCLVLVGGVS